MRSLTLAVSVLVLTGYSRDVFETFSTFADAKHAGAFDRHWLPRDLLECAKSIEVRGNEEIDLFAGGFSLPKQGLRELSARLEPYPEDPIGAFSGRDPHLAVYIAAKNAEGLMAGVIYQEPHMWVLTCNVVDLRCMYQRRTEGTNKQLQPIGRKDAPVG